MTQIETYEYNKPGYCPFLIRDNWQVAQLNALPGYGMTDIQMLEVHTQTDEVFVLFEGEAVLITAEINDSGLFFEMIKMRKGITHNIPAGVWHNIAMDTVAKLIIIENAGTHLNDCTYRDLDETQQARLYADIQRALK